MVPRGSVLAPCLYLPQASIWLEGLFLQLLDRRIHHLASSTVCTLRVEVVGGKLKGDNGNRRWVLDWEEEGRKYRGLLGGWNILADKMRDLGKDQLDRCLVGWWGVDFVPALGFSEELGKPPLVAKGEIESGFSGWNPEAGYFRQGASIKEAWVRVVGLPLHIIGRQGATQFSVGSGCFVIQLWWETHPSFVQVVSASKNCMAGSSKAREAVEERPHADYCGDLRERVTLVEVQRGVQNVSLHEGGKKELVLILLLLLLLPLNWGQWWRVDKRKKKKREIGLNGGPICYWA
ncbi:hypothetical protein CK203_106160 [Vitis vinifera]|uniref:DUF4283 domain-containing protein n=1 Tax=Vitis vinifera TaxID=29760 RepID=A0A438CD52_VITVI|nr:hypothetical protein CK203_106160 [Vitis vinifera]